MSSTPQNRRLKVVHLITDLDRGGAETMLARLVERIDRRRIDSQVICLTHPGPIAGRIAAAGIGVDAIGMAPGRISLAAIWRLVRVLRAARPDLLQTWLYHADLLGTLAGRLVRVPGLIWNIRCAELDMRDHPASLRLVLRLLAALSRVPLAVICNSESGLHAHEAIGYRPRRWEIVGNGFDTERFRPSIEAKSDLRRQLGLPEDTPLIGLLARYHPMKDHVTFLRAARTVHDARPDAHFALVGRDVPGNPALLRLIDDLALRDHVHLQAETDRPSAFLAGLDLAVCSSYSEAFPNVVGEAMACGVPCVVTDVGASADLVGPTGVVVPVRQPEAMAAGILRLLALDRAARAALGQSARQRIVQEFSLDRVVSCYEKLYSDAAGLGPHSVEPSVCAE